MTVYVTGTLVFGTADLTGTFAPFHNYFNSYPNDNLGHNTVVELNTLAGVGTTSLYFTGLALSANVNGTFTGGTINALTIDNYVPFSGDWSISLSGFSVLGTDWDTQTSNNTQAQNLFAGDTDFYLFGPGGLIMTAGNGNDIGSFGDGTMNLAFGNGKDVVVVGNGNDTITFGTGNDYVAVGNGNDTITVGHGATVAGSSWSSVVLGGGVDVVSAQGTNAYVVGGSGYDYFVAGAGTDAFLAGQGNDTFYVGTGINYLEFTTPAVVASHLDVVNSFTANDYFLLPTAQNGHTGNYFDGTNSFIYMPVGGSYFYIEVTNTTAAQLAGHILYDL